MHRFLDVSAPPGATFWCLFLFIFFLMARKSNMVPNSGADFDPRKHLLTHVNTYWDKMFKCFIFLWFL